MAIGLIMWPFLSSIWKIVTRCDVVRDCYKVFLLGAATYSRASNLIVNALSIPFSS